MNYISLVSVVSAAHLVKKGRIFSLGQTLGEETPAHWFHGAFLYCTYRNIEQGLKLISKGNQNTNEYGAMNGRIEMSDHTGTHIDALNHVSIRNLLYNGNDARKITTEHGTTKLGIDTMPPLFTRGVLADMTIIKKHPERYVIGLGDLNDVLNKENIKLNRGDALLIFTGYEKVSMKSIGGYVPINKPIPGIGYEVANWLVEVGVVAVGSDTRAVEVQPNEDPSEIGPIHQLLVAKNGIHLIENMVLSELAKEKAYEFLFVCSPLRIKGATGSPLNPLAIT